MTPLTTSDFQAARAIAHPYIHRTPILTSAALSEITGANILLKAELFQRTGSYKIRGPLNVLSKMSAEEKSRGIICSSAGNHAQGVAYAARVHNIPATVVMSVNAPAAKVNATRGYGATVIQHGEIWDDAYAHSRQIQEEQGLTYIHPFDDPRLIAGQGGVGLEIAEDVPNVDYVIVPIGGGGLISGVAMAIKAAHPNAKVIGIESSGAPAMSRSVSEGKRVVLENVTSVVDGLVVRQVGVNNLWVVQNYVDDIVLVDDTEIFDSVVWLMERCKLVAEGAAAATVAALRTGRLTIPKGKTAVCVLSGGNLKLEQLQGLKWN
ncbi:threonine/serine dehydratase [Ottowia thiooxydans]|uniref:Threonine dehydratase n=1 Tax=Ottowia thiooxydans TaxID=219182 RepID=A0ABV2QBG1_9BURK